MKALKISWKLLKWYLFIHTVSRPWVILDKWKTPSTCIKIKNSHRNKFLNRPKRDYCFEILAPSLFIRFVLTTVRLVSKVRKTHRSSVRLYYHICLSKGKVMPEYRTEWDGRSLLERHEISNNWDYAFTLLNDQLNTTSKWSTGNQLKRQQGTKNYHLFYSLRGKGKIVRYIVKDFIIFALLAKCFGFVNVNYFWNESEFFMGFSRCCK